jgi:hypothetical protein
MLLNIFYIGKYKMSYSIAEESRNCIDKYLDIYGIVLETCEKNYFKYSLKFINGRMTLTSNNKIVGNLEYSLNNQELFIENIEIKDNNVPIKLTKIFLLYLLSLYSDRVKYVKLVSSPPDKYKRNRDFCLTCYYQQLGFLPEQDDDERYQRLDKIIKECKSRLSKNEYKNLLSMCILCKCQDDIIAKRLKNFKINDLQVDMKALIPNIKLALKNDFEHIIQKCLI